MYTDGTMYSKFLFLLVPILIFSMAKSIVKFLWETQGQNSLILLNAVSKQGLKSLTNSELIQQLDAHLHEINQNYSASGRQLTRHC